MAINHYQLLGIPEDADFQRIKAAYRSMAKRFHPDTNKGSEAAAELFRKINEAYRVLSDDRLRILYNQQLVATGQAPVKQAPRKEEKPVTADPQQKFNRFLNSLLDAIFEAPEDANAEIAAKKRAPPKPKSTRNVPRKPDFNFYYYLAMEQTSHRYQCDEDGIFRRTKNSGQAQNARGIFRGGPGSNLLILLLSGLWEVLRQ